MGDRISMLRRYFEIVEQEDRDKRRGDTMTGEAQELLANGWYQVTNKRGMYVVHRVIDNAILTNVGRIGIDVYQDAGCTIERVEVCDIEALAKMRQALAAAQERVAELSEMNYKLAERSASFERKLAQQPATVPLDAPDSPGWWAFEGYINYANGADPNRIKREVVRVFWGKITDAWHTVGESGRRPAYMMVGKWWRMTMPWNAQPKEGDE